MSVHRSLSDSALIPRRRHPLDARKELSAVWAATVRRRLTAVATTVALAASLMAGAAAPVLAEAEQPALPAFPGAEGLGWAATGGRGGEVYHVTSKELTGEGTLHHALTTTADTPRTIVFDVSGNLPIPQIVVEDASNITLAGQTAPGDGVTVMGNTIRIVDSHDIVIRHLRFRMGKHDGVNDDTMYIENSQNVIIDHSSFSWGTDEVLSIKSKNYENPTSRNITVQWSIISEGLLTHSMGGLIEMNTISMHHNLYAHNNDRNPKTKGQIDFVNNTVYNWGDFPYVAGGESGTKGYGNVVGNTFIAGVNSGSPDDAIVRGNENYQVFLEGNVIDSDRDGELNPVNTGEDMLEEERPAVVVDERFAYPPVHTQDALEAHEMTLEHAGASLVRDAVDERVIRSVREQSGAIIDHQDDVGGYPALKEAAPPRDTDRDGMPDRWERKNHLDPRDPTDRNGDRDRDGYTNLEEHLNELAAPSFPEAYPRIPMEWSGEQFEPPTVPDEETRAMPLPPLNGEIIRGGTVHDNSSNGAENAAAWSVQQDLQTGDVVAGDRDAYLFTDVPEQLMGAEWIRTAVGSRSASDEDVLRFHVAADATVFIAHDARITEDPAWLVEGYEPTGLTLTDSQPVSWELFSREVAAGTEVVTGPNGGGSRMNYLVIVVPISPSGVVPGALDSAPTVKIDAAAGPSVVDLSWDTAEGASSYLVQRSTAADPSWRVIGASTAGAFTDPTAQLGVRNDYRIVPVAAGGAAEPSAGATVLPVDPAVPMPEVPQDLEITETSSYAVSLTWAPTGGSDGYAVQRATGPGGEFEDLAYSTSTSFKDASAEPETDYRYRVAAGSAGGMSTSSPPVATTTGPAMEIPNAPGEIRVTTAEVAETSFEWDAVDGAQEYLVLRAVDGTGPASEIARVTEPAFSDQDLSASATGYTYSIIAANERGQSAPSAAVRVRGLVPEAPSALRVTLRGDTFIGLAWDRGAGSEKIEVLRIMDGTPQPVGTAKVNTTFIRELDPEHEYAFRLRATNAVGVSELSAPITVTTLPLRWDAEARYRRGDRVGHDGVIWEATRHTHGDLPGSSQAWAEQP